MSSAFWEQAEVAIVWEKPGAFVRTMVYDMETPSSAGPGCYNEGFGFFFYTDGVFDLKLQGQSHVVDPTCLIFNHQHDEWEVEVNPDAVVRATDIVVDERFVRQLAPQLDHHAVFKLPKPHATTSHAISQLHARLLREIERGSPRLLIDSLVTILCADAMRRFIGDAIDFSYKKQQTDFEIDLIEEAKLQLLSQMRADISLDALAARLELSPFHLMRLFKKRTGQTPHQYLTNERINLAKRLLLDTRDGITQIAYHVGYQNPSHFAAQFRRKTGLNPSAYRAKS